MAHSNPSDEDLAALLSRSSTIAMVGASSNPAKPSYVIMRQLQRAGYRVIPVNSREAEVLGERAYAALADVGVHIDIVDVFRRAEDTPAIADDAVKAGAGALWLQTGISNDNAADRAQAAGLTVVMDACIGATHTRLRIRPRQER